MTTGKPFLQNSDYERIRKSLSIFDASIAEFCRDYGYEEQRSGLGRYPRRRVNRYGEINIFFDLSMDLTPEGNYYAEFTDDVPFSMTAGAWIDEKMERWSISFTCFGAVEAKTAKEILSGAFRQGSADMQKWTSTYIKEMGTKSHLRQ